MEEILWIMGALYTRNTPLTEGRTTLWSWETLIGRGTTSQTQNLNHPQPRLLSLSLSRQRRNSRETRMPSLIQVWMRFLNVRQGLVQATWNLSAALIVRGACARWWEWMELNRLWTGEREMKVSGVQSETSPGGLPPTRTLSKSFQSTHKNWMHKTS